MKAKDKLKWQRAFFPPLNECTYSVTVDGIDYSIHGFRGRNGYNGWHLVLMRKGEFISDYSESWPTLKKAKERAEILANTVNKKLIYWEIRQKTEE